MSDQISEEERARLIFDRYYSRMGRETRFEAMLSQLDLWKSLSRMQEQRFIRLVEEVDRNLRARARSSSSDVSIWALAMATVQNNAALPIDAPTRSLANLSADMFQQAGGEVLSRCQKQQQLFLEPVENAGAPTPARAVTSVNFPPPAPRNR